MELLAPAGSPDALRAALGQGADAVYLAGRRFGARASSAGFDRAELAWARRVTLAAGRRLYVAVNTLVFESEWPAMEAHLDQLADLGVDAVIVQDLGVLVALRRRGHSLPAHLSTQAAWDGAGGVSLLASLGVRRVILPRETSLDVVERVVSEAPFEVEVFVHGASCYSISGRCWWSEALGGRSGNRGLCAQPCRRDYRALPQMKGAQGTSPVAACDRGPLLEAGGEPWFSPRDLQLLEHLDALAKAGVTSVKIEGRLKDPDYVATVTAVYRAALDGAEPEPGLARLQRVYQRRAMPGFLHGPPTVWRTGRVVGRAGVSVGTISRARAAGGLTELCLTQGLQAGDGVAWDTSSGRRGARVTWVDQPGPGDRRVRLRGDSPGRSGVPLYRTGVADDDHPLKGWEPRWETLAVTIAVRGQEGEPLSLLSRGPGIDVERVSTVPLSRARGEGLEVIVVPRLLSLPPPFVVASVDLSGLQEGLFLPPKALKAVRRELVAALNKAVATPAGEEGKLGAGGSDPPGGGIGPREPLGTQCSYQAPKGSHRRALGDPHESSRAGAHGADGTEGGVRIRLFRREDLGHLMDLHPSGGWILPAQGALPELDASLGSRVGYWLPPVSGPDAVSRLLPLVQKLPPQAELLCLSWEAFRLCRLFPERVFRLDWTFNIANPEALAVIREAGLLGTSSPELPEPLPGAVAPVRLNPLLSLSRFPPGDEALADFGNTHGDRFSQRRLGEDAWGLFLHRLPGRPRRLSWKWGVQLDVMLLEPGDSAALAEWLAWDSCGGLQGLS